MAKRLILQAILLDLRRLSCADRARKRGQRPREQARTERMAGWMALRRPGGAMGLGLWLVLGLSGCGSTDAAAPVATRGETVLATAGPVAGSAAVQVTSAKGWQCEGLYAPEADRMAAVRFPMDCSDDVDTTALMRVNPSDGRAALLFSRKDGTSGKATFALAR